ncbi:magnesium/cobalt transporter CorA [Yinghuangia sp. ASG 101]|uniref:magnesium/cobalt transporter CorA n=1 Tax=Yinghuangia sp. ASG 101 TaxID=2896848 RepID=UPI001E625FE3|nr:magnesium/cobalt transporter CorA [Yinghuangia sp. ASG 101]UGQ10560.1 magnesium/cobalt transporter CorA [Yinghuangia sp. ASG 101]
MIVDCAIYRNGVRTPGPADFSDALDEARASGDAFLWIGLHEPTEKEFELVTSEFGLHPLAVEDALHAHQRPKLDLYEDSVFVVLKTLRYTEESSAVETGELMIFVGDSFIVTVRHGTANPLSDVRRRLERQDDVLRYGPGAVMYAVCDAVVDAYVAVATELEVDLQELEGRVFSTNRDNDTERIYLLKREVLEFRRAAQPLSDPIRRLATSDVLYVPTATQPFFRDVGDNLARVNEQVEAFDRLLSDVLSANLAQVGVRQNEDMRKISAWAAMAAVPTMLAGIYGMNFKHMPELRQWWGYPAVLIVMVVVCLVLHRLFRRNGWL